MKKVLIVGANSYIGDSFARHVASDKEFQVDIVDSMNDAWKEKDFSEYDTVYHVAGIAHVKETPEVTALYEKINYKMAVEVAKHAKECGVKQFVIMSSMSVFGESGKVGKEKVIEKTDEFSPINNYGKYKLLADKEIDELRDNKFKIASIRPPMVYGKECKGNFNSLSKFAEKSFVFPKINNKRSMIFIDNLAEFIKLVILNESDGYFYPQNTEYVVTSEMVRLIKQESQNKKIWLTKLFNPLIYVASKFLGTINKVFGNLVYAKELSNTFDWQYNIVDFEESVKRSIANK